MSRTFHVITRGNNKADVFHEEYDFKVYEEIVANCMREIPFEIYNQALMDNHAHNIMRPKEDGALPEIMQTINQRYSLAHKRRYGFVGHLWQNRYRRYEIDNDGYLLTCGIYIELNAVRAKMVENPVDYRWSSHRAYVAGENNPLITPSPAYLGLANNEPSRRSTYIALTEMWQSRPVSSAAAKKFFKRGAKTLHPDLDTRR